MFQRRSFFKTFFDLTWHGSEMDNNFIVILRLSNPKHAVYEIRQKMDLLCFCSVLCLLCLCARLIICALWSPAGKGLTSWLSFVVSYCEFVTFPLVSWVRCGTWSYRFLIFAPLLTLIGPLISEKKCVWKNNIQLGWKIKGQSTFCGYQKS